MNTFGPVFLAVVVGGIVAVAVVVLRAVFSDTGKSRIRSLFLGIDLKAISWGVAGVAAACLITIAAAGFNSNERLLATILMHPTDFLMWPSILGFLGGLSVWVIKRR